MCVYNFPLVCLQGTSPLFCASARTSLSGICGARLFTSLTFSLSALVASSVGGHSTSFCDLLSHVDCGGITDSLCFFQTDASLSSSASKSSFSEGQKQEGLMERPYSGFGSCQESSRLIMVLLVQGSRFDYLVLLVLVITAVPGIGLRRD